MNIRNEPQGLTEAEAFRIELEDQNDDLSKRAEELEASFQKAPATVNAENVGDVNDFIVQLGAYLKKAEDRRKTTKEPFLDRGRWVDGYFKDLMLDIEKAKKAMTDRLTTHLQAVEREERRRRAAEAAAAAAEAERLRKEAAAAEAAAQDDLEIDAAIDAAIDSDKATADAEQARRDAEVKAAEISRTRGSYGGVSSLATSWEFRDLDIDKIDLEKLRHHLNKGAIESALRSYIKAGNRQIAGAEIYEKTSARVR